MTEFVLDTGFYGLDAAKCAEQSAGAKLLAVTASPDCQNYEDVVFALANTLKHTPVYKGAARPMLRDILAPHTAPKAEEKNKLAPGHAVNALIEAANTHPGITVVCLGPLTNLALALLKEPSLREKIGKLIIAGGAQLGYNAFTETAEYNIYVDAEAADTVFKSEIELYLFPKEASTDYRRSAVAFALNCDAAENIYDAFVDADVASSHTYGQTVIDPIGYNPITFERHAGKKSKIVSKVNEALVAKLLLEVK